MRVPKAAMYEDSFSTTGKGNVGFTRQIFAMKPITISHRVQASPNDHFWLGVLAFHSLHNASALFGRPSIHDQFSRI